MNALSAEQVDREQLPLSEPILRDLVAGAQDSSPVSGLTHNHYKYPARFSPKFIRAAIAAFTQPGDLVLDPFVGGGTTMVEALAAGRNCVGVDISSLATFVTDVKTLLLTDGEVAELRTWATALPATINMASYTVDFATGHHDGYYRNLEGKRFWRIRKAFEQALASAIQLSGNAEQVARCVVLRTAQWALDGRVKLPTVDGFRKALVQNADSMISGSLDFRAVVSKSDKIGIGLSLNRSAVDLEKEPEVLALGKPRLVLTSPPYPGIHVLYHRWQVDGRKETPAPFLIANKLDGSGESYYTLGHRKNPGLKTYWASLAGVLKSSVKLSDENTIFVQVVAFNDPTWQLPEYLRVCEEAGLREVFLDVPESPDGRLWRNVPNRRWYADQMGAISASQEVVLFHRMALPFVTPHLPPLTRSTPPVDLPVA